eukprot:351140-Chlamydomonas_euryale.AAC.30
MAGKTDVSTVTEPHRAGNTASALMAELCARSTVSPPIGATSGDATPACHPKLSSTTFIAWSSPADTTASTLCCCCCCCCRRCHTTPSALTPDWCTGLSESSCGVWSSLPPGARPSGGQHGMAHAVTPPPVAPPKTSHTPLPLLLPGPSRGAHTHVRHSMGCGPASSFPSRCHVRKVTSRLNRCTRASDAAATTNTVPLAEANSLRLEIIATSAM